MLLITPEESWSQRAFESAVEGMGEQLDHFPYERVPFRASTSPEVIFLFFAIWKRKKIACPLSTRLPSAHRALEELGAPLFTPLKPLSRPPRPWELKEEQIATLLFTSGTGGKSKIACHTAGNHLYSALGAQSLVPLGPGDRWLLSLPLFHIGGIAILWRCYLSGSTLVLSSSYEQITHLSLVPTQLYRLMEKGESLPHLRYLLLGGAKGRETQSRWNILPTYGMTEMSSQIITQGKVLPYREVKIAADGEILVKGATLFQGYLTPENTLSLPLDQEGWFATRDLGKWKENGEFEILGRKDNLFISGGENIQPEEIEMLLKELFKVEEVVVVPLPDQEFGSLPVVFLSPLYSLEEVASLLREHLPKYKIPRAVFPLPSTSSLKFNRAQLIQLAQEMRGSPQP